MQIFWILHYGSESSLCLPSCLNGSSENNAAAFSSVIEKHLCMHNLMAVYFIHMVQKPFNQEANQWTLTGMKDDQE